MASKLTEEADNSNDNNKPKDEEGNCNSELTFVMRRPCCFENTDFVPKSRVDIFGKEFQEAKEKFSVQRDAIWPPCDKGIWVNSMENEPLASMMCQNLITVVTAIPVVWGALGSRLGKFIEETHCSILI